MPPHKSAKKSAKKVAKKAAKKAAAKHHHGNKAGEDARRSFEHLGRVEAIAHLTTSEHESIQILTRAAESALKSDRFKDSAELLRAAEHLSFASIVDAAPQEVSAELSDVIHEQVAHLTEKAEQHGSAEDAPRPIRSLYLRMLKDSEAALRRGAYRGALEFARAAEALTHVHFAQNQLPSGNTHSRSLRP